MSMTVSHPIQSTCLMGRSPTADRRKTLRETARWRAVPSQGVGQRRQSRAEAGVPEEVEFVTKIVLARRMIDRAVEAGVPAKWVTADAVYGSDYHSRTTVEGHGLGYVVRGVDGLRGVGRVPASACRGVAPGHPADAWHRLSCGTGVKGSRVCDWALTRTNSREPDEYARWVLIRRSVSDLGEVAYFACGGPPATTLNELVRVAGARWAIEDLFELAKGDCGLGRVRGADLDRVAPARDPELFALAVVAVIRSRVAEPAKRGREADRVDCPRGAEVAPAAGVGPRARGRASAGVVTVAAGTPAPGARLPLPHTRSKTAKLTTAVGQDRSRLSLPQARSRRCQRTRLQAEPDLLA